MSNAVTSLAKCTETVWNPLNIFQCPCDHAIVVLNRPINWSSSNALLKLWQTAKLKVTVDGGTNRWFDYVNKITGYTLSDMPKMYLPDLVTGDFDSITPSLLEKLKHTDVKIVHTPDQNETDYTKALFQIKEYCKLQKINLRKVYVVTETSGRFDHAIGIINTLYKALKFFSEVQVTHISSEDLTWLLPAGKHRISIPELLLRSHCGLLPFGSSDNCVSTTGLKWDLDKQCLKYGGMISTSNTYNGSPEVTVDTDTPLIWTMGIVPLIENEEAALKL